jgi:hypothetical protein
MMNSFTFCFNFAFKFNLRRYTVAANAAVAAATAAAADARYYRAPERTPRRSLCIDPDSNVCRLARMVGPVHIET